MNYRDRKLLDLAYEFPCLLRYPGCEGTVGEPAHSNEQIHGKGMGIKAHDCWHVPACRHCHRIHDQGKELTRDQRRESFRLAFDRYYPELWKRELIVVNPGFIGSDSFDLPPGMTGFRGAFAA